MAVTPPPGVIERPSPDFLQTFGFLEDFEVLKSGSHGEVTGTIPPLDSPILGRGPSPRWVVGDDPPLGACPQSPPPPGGSLADPATLGFLKKTGRIVLKKI